MIQNHEIDFRIYGEEMQYVEIELDPNETAMAEPGAFMMMEDGISMQTIFGDGSNNQGGGLLGKLMNAGKRVLAGENLFMTAFTNIGNGKKHVSFASPYPGKIIPLNLLELGGTVICQKDAFLCAAKGISIGIEFQKKLGTGLFGGEGFIMERLDGDGMAFMHASGYVQHALLASQPDLARTVVYACGSSAMIRSAKASLRGGKRGRTIRCRAGSRQPRCR